MLDTGLALVLIVFVPALAVWREAVGARQSRIARYRQAGTTILACLAVLAMQWAISGREIAQLGLALPLSPGGWVRLGAVAALVIMLYSAIRRTSAKRRRPAPDEADPLLTTGAERTAFIGLAFVAGIGWEILYRGFLLWYLSPLLGAVGAVCLAAIAYGAAHGLRNPRKAAGSIVSAFLFTIGFALTHDLWWLMLLHTGLPLAIVATRAREALAAAA